MVSAEADRWQVEIPFDARFFLDVPPELRGGIDGDVRAWARQIQADRVVQPEWRDDPRGVDERLVGQAQMLSPEAFAAFLFCPRGLPAEALVEVFISESTLHSLEVMELDSPVALPQRTHPVSSPLLGEGRVVSSVGATGDGAAIGQLRYQFLSDGVLVDLSVTSVDLGILGAGMPIFEELATGIGVVPSEERTT